MVTIRLSRGGAKKQPFYHIVATDSRARRDGRYIERLGFYNPVARSSAEPVRMDLERIDHWVENGAQMSDRVKKIVKSYRIHGAEDPTAEARASKKAARRAARKAAAAAPSVEEAEAATEEAAASEDAPAAEEPAEAKAEEAPEAKAEEAPAEEAPAAEEKAEDAAAGDDGAEEKSD